MYSKWHTVDSGEPALYRALSHVHALSAWLYVVMLLLVGVGAVSGCFLLRALWAAAARQYVAITQCILRLL